MTKMLTATGFGSHFFCYFSISILILASSSLSAQSYPPTPKHAVENLYHGVAVSDDYQWLEDSEDVSVKAWVEEQNQISLSALGAIRGRQSLTARIRSLMLSQSARYENLKVRAGMLFAIKTQPPHTKDFLVRMNRPGQPRSEKVVLDLNTHASGSMEMDFYEPSPDGKLVAVSLSTGGTEDGSLHVIDVATGKEIDVALPRVNYATAGGSVSWNKDAKGFFYTRYPRPGERPDEDMFAYQQVYFHKIGNTIDQDRYEIGKDFPRIAEITLFGAKSGEQIALVRNGAGGDRAYFVRSKDTWQRLAGFDDGVRGVSFGNDGWLYLLSIKNAPNGEILRVPAAEPTLAKAQLVVPQSNETLQRVVINAGRRFTVSMLGGPSKLTVTDLTNLKTVTIELPTLSTLSSLVSLDNGDMLANIETDIVPPAWYLIGRDNKLVKTELAMTISAEFGDTEVVREYAVSKDGTRIPLNIIRRKDVKLDGRNPTLLSGYGGFGISQRPGFSRHRRVWLDHGGIYVYAALRGGGEYGDAWRRAGKLSQKQNTFDDFVAAAEHLIAKGYTSPSKLGIKGGSNGALLMGAVMTQRPELFRAVHASAGSYDMLRFELEANGAFVTTEYGSVKDKSQFDSLLAYSPYHRVSDGTPYPAILMTTGDNDRRVSPGQSRKMIARLQAANPAGRPILLRTSTSSGHGASSLDEEIAEITDSYAFLLWQLGVEFDTESR